MDGKDYIGQRKEGSYFGRGSKICHILENFRECSVDDFFNFKWFMNLVSSKRASIDLIF